VHAILERHPDVNWARRPDGVIALIAGPPPGHKFKPEQDYAAVVQMLIAAGPQKVNARTRLRKEHPEQGSKMEVLFACTGWRPGRAKAINEIRLFQGAKRRFMQKWPSPT